jgi:hypothetical protein
MSSPLDSRVEGAGPDSDPEGFVGFWGPIHPTTVIRAQHDWLRYSELLTVLTPEEIGPKIGGAPSSRLNLIYAEVGWC